MRGSQNITPTLKKAVWDLYIGPGIQYTSCPLCGLRQISQNANSGFQCAHVVARKYFDKESLSSFYLFPSCSACNNECSDTCLLDYLWQRERLPQLRKLIMAVFNAFVSLHQHEIPVEEQQVSGSLHVIHTAFLVCIFICFLKTSSGLACH